MRLVILAIILILPYIKFMTSELEPFHLIRPCNLVIHGLIKFFYEPIDNEDFIYRLLYFTKERIRQE